MHEVTSNTTQSIRLISFLFGTLLFLINENKLLEAGKGGKRILLVRVVDKCPSSRVRVKDEITPVAGGKCN